MEQRTLQYTVKVYGEGSTEWFYFEGLRTCSHFRFSLEPQIPKSSRSSYKQNLKLIDVELRKKPQERADAIFLVIDTDVMVRDKRQHSEYLRLKELYKKRGVTFIESHPCMELWFWYHLADRFARTSYEAYEALRPEIERVLPKYEKTKKYYQKDTFFRANILNDAQKRALAVERGMRSCSYAPADGETANYTEIFKVVMFFSLLQKFSEIKMLLCEALRKPIRLEQDVRGHSSLTITQCAGNDRVVLCTLKYNKAQMACVMPDGASCRIDDKVPLAIGEDVIARLIEVVR